MIIIWLYIWLESSLLIMRQRTNLFGRVRSMRPSFARANIGGQKGRRKWLYYWLIILLHFTDETAKERPVQSFTGPYKALKWLKAYLPCLISFLTAQDAPMGLYERFTLFLSNECNEYKEIYWIPFLQFPVFIPHSLSCYEVR